MSQATSQTMLMPSGSTAHPLLKLDGIAKTYSSAGTSVSAIASIHLTIQSGEFVSIVGPSGCGKSTLLQIVAGLLQPSAGSVRLEEKPVSGPPEGMVCLFQQYSRSLFPWLTVERNVEFGFRHMREASRAEASDRCRRFLAMVGLEDFRSKYPWELSGGMQQRVAIARALAAEPRVLLLDEPFSSVDALTRLELHGLILDLWSAAKLTIVLVTHDVEEAVYLSDRIVLLTSRPARIAEVFSNDLPRPRRPVESREDPRFLSLQHELLTRLLRKQ